LGSYLYFVVGNDTTGLEVWRTANGTSWEQVGFTGFGNSNNFSSYWSNSVTEFNNGLYVGTLNITNGGEVWLFLSNQVFLPVVLK